MQCTALDSETGRWQFQCSSQTDAAQSFAIKALTASDEEYLDLKRNKQSNIYVYMYY